jgi:hypothetical protein
VEQQQRTLLDLSGADQILGGLINQNETAA